MEIAFSPTTPGLSAADLVDLSVLADELGYRAAWLAEVAGPEAFSLAGAIAAATSRLDLGVAVVPAATRTPALLAMGAATVSSLLRGRSFGLGIGSSSEVIVDRWHGRPFSPPLLRVRETVEATRALLAGERSFAGSTTQAAGFRLGTDPAGPISLLVGALGPRMLALAGEVGDGVCLNLMTASSVGKQLAEVERGAASAGRTTPDDFMVMARFHVVVTDDVDAGRNLIRAGFGPYFGQPVYNRFLAWMGFPDQAAAIGVAFAAGDRQGVADAFSDEVVDAVTLVGPPGVINDRLGEYEEAGIGMAALSFLGADASGVAAALRDLGPGSAS